jgi:demethylmenaquinone methyltransferase/2-methoxy-6-polyprenyl-1,4-benzoquinol methylase
VNALQLRRGDTVVEIGCGTGLNFGLLQEAVVPEGRIVGVDLTDAMLAHARCRIDAHGWTNLSLVQADALEFDVPCGVDAIISSYTLSLVPECTEVIARGCQALAPGGHWAVLDIEMPDGAPGWLRQAGLATLRPFAANEQWMARRPWEALRAAMHADLIDFTWQELFFGFTYLADGRRGS